MDFFPQCSPLLKLLAKGRQNNSFTAFMYGQSISIAKISISYTFFSFEINGSLYLQDGTWDTVKGSFTIVRDFLDVCYHSYFSIMDDLRFQGPSAGKYYEIRHDSL